MVSPPRLHSFVFIHLKLFDRSERHQSLCSWIPVCKLKPPFLFFLWSQIELAILRFPYDTWGTPFQQLKQVVEEPSPQLPADQFSPEFVDFTSLWYVGVGQF